MGTTHLSHPMSVLNIPTRLRSVHSVWRPPARPCHLSTCPWRGPRCAPTRDPRLTHRRWRHGRQRRPSNGPCRRQTSPRKLRTTRVNAGDESKVAAHLVREGSSMRVHGTGPDDAVGEPTCTCVQIIHDADTKQSVLTRFAVEILCLSAALVPHGVMHEATARTDLGQVVHGTWVDEVLCERRITRTPAPLQRVPLSEAGSSHSSRKCSAPSGLEQTTPV